MAYINRVYAETDDFGITSSGTGSTTFTSGTRTLQAASSSTHDLRVTNDGVNNANVGQYFVRFDTSTLPDSFSSPTLVLNVVSSATGGGQTNSLSVRGYNWSSESTAEWRTATEFTALPSFATTSEIPNGFTGDFSIPLSGWSKSDDRFVLRRTASAYLANTVYTMGVVVNSGNSANAPYLNVITGDPWQYVGASSVVEVTATSHTLTEPAGVAEGDLLVACFAIRTTNTGSVTLPSGWTLATQSYINNTTANSTAGAASGVIAYCIRGASAPAMTFTHPAAPSVARGQIVAYRNSDPTQATVLDVAASTRLTTAATAISVAGITTTQDDDLLVGVIAGGRNITVTNFNNATGGTSSGTGASITAAPAPNTWQERADAGTATGADTGLSIFDAVDTVAGATGNFTATASASALHLVMVAAFKIKPVDTGPAGIVGTAAVNDGTDTASASALVPTKAYGAISDGNDAAAAAGAVRLVAAASVADGNDIASAAASTLQAILASASVQDGDDVASAAALLRLLGAAAVADSNDSASAAGVLRIAAAAAVSDGSDATSGLAALRIAAAAGVADGNDQAAGQGGAVLGGLASVEDDHDLASASASAAIKASADVVDAYDATESTGGAPQALGNADVSDGDDIVSASGRVAVHAAGATLDAEDAVSAAAACSIRGVAELADGDDLAAASAVVPVGAGADATDEADAAAAGGVVILGASGEVFDRDDVAVGAGIVRSADARRYLRIIARAPEPLRIVATAEASPPIIARAEAPLRIVARAEASQPIIARAPEPLRLVSRSRI